MESDGKILINGTILTPLKKIHNNALFLRNSSIEKIVPEKIFYSYEREYRKNYEIIDVKKNYIAPGFIDIHTHGANNIDASSGPYGPFAEFKAQHGTTGFLPTFWNSDFEILINACKKISRYIKNNNKDGARILGINSEGPYINPDMGAQYKDRALVPVYRDYARLIESAEGNLKIMTVSPEIKGYDELVKYLKHNNVTVAICYSNASIRQLHHAIGLGLTHIDHIFDGVIEPSGSEKGVKPCGIQDELLICDDLMAEVIADKKGIHVAPALLKILLRCKGAENIILITDSRDITGNPPGEYIMNDGFKAVIREEDDVVRLEDGALAGCIMTMDMTIKNMIRHTGISLEKAVMMATCNPARALKISHKKGELREGMDADIAVFDENINVKMTFVEGKLCYVHN